MENRLAMENYSVIAVLTSFNRKDKTLEALKLLESAGHNVRLTAVLVDDGSHDGTSNAVSDNFDWVDVLQGTGNLYWCGGMRMAMEMAMKRTPDFILWLNDDTQLFENSIDSLIKTALISAGDPHQPCIVVGSTRDSQGNLSYGGRKQTSKLFPTRFSLVTPSTAPLPCDAMNGNCVLISNGAYIRLGNIDSRYIHSFGDFDYALRARKLEIPVWVAPGYIGQCRNDHFVKGSFIDTQLSFRKRWNHLLSPKELSPKAWWVYCKSHCGILWPLFWAWPYVKVVGSSLIRK